MTPASAIPMNVTRVCPLCRNDHKPDTTCQTYKRLHPKPQPVNPFMQRLALKSFLRKFGQVKLDVS